MSPTLEQLAAQLEAAVPAKNGAPADYEAVIQTAAAQYGNDRPRVAVYTIDVLAGTATYTLPDDFVYEISLDSPWGANDIAITNEGLVPLPEPWYERHTISGNSLTFDPVPTYTAERKLRYAAGHVLNDGNAYPAMTTGDAHKVLLYAQWVALMQQAKAQAGTAVKYQIGDEMVDTGVSVAGTMKQADAVLKEYRAAIAVSFGGTARYTDSGQLV